MKKFLLFCLAFSFITLSQAQTDTYIIDWSFGSNPSATGDANANRTIEEGDTVTWNWYATGTHNVVSASDATESFSSQLLGPGSTFSYTFTQVGTNDYVCTPHSGNMFGTITVVPDGTLNTEDFITFENIKLYPNPATDILNLNINGAFLTTVNINIYNTLGQAVKSFKNVSSSDLTLDISDLNTGLYLIRIEGDDSFVTKRLMVK